jgi:regulator of PEP synthase PpsR (kinase-PPPase family)
MDETQRASQSGGVPPIYVVSGGAGTSGEQVVRTALAQFPDAGVPVILVPHVRREEQLVAVVAQAAASRGAIVHTLVDAEMRRRLIRLAQEQQVVAIDLIGHLLAHLTSVLGREPVGQPGLYRQLYQAYFDRVDAIEFAVAHDDGRNPQDWPRADVVLAGVSRTGKTPLSMYLAVQGWKVANVPLIPELPPPELLRLDPRRVVGLVIEPDRLLIHRRRRQHRLRLPPGVAYADVAAVAEELDAARRLFRQHGFAVVDVTDKPIEESANDVIGLIGRLPRGPADGAQSL